MPSTTTSMVCFYQFIEICEYNISDAAVHKMLYSAKKLEAHNNSRITKITGGRRFLNKKLQEYNNILKL